MLSPAEWSAVRLTAELAGLSTLLLLLVGTPMAWWLARTRSPAKPVWAALVAMPLVLPPTVIGFYLLLLMGPQGPVGQLTQALGLGRLPFTFAGLVVASVIYSLPFVVQPLQQAFEAIPERTLEAAATLRASPWDRFFSVAVPLARPGFVTASVLGFAHTVGEFGVVLMIGGNIPDKTRVLSVAIYDHVEATEFAEAHRLAAGMVVFALVVLVTLYVVNRPAARSAPAHDRGALWRCRAAASRSTWRCAAAPA
jgi:molybdate transport system permease protein